MMAAINSILICAGRVTIRGNGMKTTRIVIAGGGFAGLYAAMHFDKRLARRADVEVTLISRENFILFLKCAMSTLSSPRRAALRRY